MKVDISIVFSNCWKKYSALISAVYLRLKQKLTRKIQSKTLNASKPAANSTDRPLHI